MDQIVVYACDKIHKTQNTTIYFLSTLDRKSTAKIFMAHCVHSVCMRWWTFVTMTII